jgi:hypothetical protein
MDSDSKKILIFGFTGVIFTAITYYVNDKLNHLRKKEGQIKS